MNTDAILAQYKPVFDRDGFVVIKGFYDAAKTREVADHLDRYVLETVPNIPPADAFYEVKGRPETLKQMQRVTDHDKWFDELRKRDDFTKLAAGLFGCAGVSQGVEWFNKPPRASSPTPPHQDGYYFMLQPNEALTMWFALDPIDTTNGCLRYVRGSHLRGLRPHARTQTLGFSQGITDFGPADVANETAIIAQPGDLLIHHGLTIHRADANTSDRHRRALGLVFYSERAKQDRAALNAYHTNLMKDLAAVGKI